MTVTAAASDIDALKARLKATWMAGDYDYFSRYMESSAVEFLDSVSIEAGSRLLDVACGSGQLALLAARRGASVTGLDIAGNSILAARGRAQADGLDARFDEGDAEEMPYADASFDVVASIFGAMFAPRPDRVASELLRVCRPGGRIAMANWTREGFVGRMFATFARFIAPPGMPPPVLWGDENVVRQRLGSGASDLQLTRVNYRFDYPFTPDGVVELFRTYYGPTTKAFEALGTAEQAALRSDLVELWSAHNVADDPARTVVDAEYLEVVAVRRRAEADGRLRTPRRRVCQTPARPCSDRLAAATSGFEDLRTPIADESGARHGAARARGRSSRSRGRARTSA
jgi:SAM-dependent methyltransferase